MNANWVLKKFHRTGVVIGVLHVPPLPGSARSQAQIGRIWDTVHHEAKIYATHGVDALLLENHGDAPFAKDAVEPHVPAILGVFADRLHAAFKLPVGLNVLRNDARSAVAAALAGGGSFVRVNVLSGVTATDQGLIEGKADEVQGYKKRLGFDVAILADADVKFGTPLYRPSWPVLLKSLVQRALADAVIVTGEATGNAPETAKLRAARAAIPETALLCGSGVTADNAPDILPLCDGLIVGSAFKADGYVENPVDFERVATVMNNVRKVRG